MRNRSPGSATSPAGSGCPIPLRRKTRRGDRSVAIAFPDPARIAGRPALIVDDIVSSGGTIIACAKALTSAGATTIDAVVTHALFPEALTATWFIRHSLDPLDP